MFYEFQARLAITKITFENLIFFVLCTETLVQCHNLIGLYINLVP
jgi:hypothetical protein